MGVNVTMSSNGRICIPADVRERLGLKDGGSLTLEETEHGLLLSTVEQRVRKAQAIIREMAKGKPTFTVDDFLRQRRSMWGDNDSTGPNG
mgnify:CR=1 FL=1